MFKPGLTRRDFLHTTSVMAGAALAGTATAVIEPPDAKAQTSTGEVAGLLKVPLQTPDTVEFQIRQYLMKLVPPLPTPKTAAEWTSQQKRLRKHLLDDVIFHGWPKEWVDAPPKFEDLGLIPSGKGYRLRKLRYEVASGFSTVALL